MNLTKIDKLLSFLSQSSTKSGLLQIFTAISYAIHTNSISQIDFGQITFTAIIVFRGLVDIMRDEDKQLKDAVAKALAAKTNV